MAIDRALLVQALNAVESALSRRARSEDAALIAKAYNDAHPARTPCAAPRRPSATRRRSVPR